MLKLQDRASGYVGYDPLLQGTLDLDAYSWCWRIIPTCLNHKPRRSKHPRNWAFGPKHNISSGFVVPETLMFPTSGATDGMLPAAEECPGTRLGVFGSK